jgi:predicted DNA-binding protein with PD1-like motif
MILLFFSDVAEVHEGFRINNDSLVTALEAVSEPLLGFFLHEHNEYQTKDWQKEFNTLSVIIIPVYSAPEHIHNDSL